MSLRLVRVWVRALREAWHNKSLRAWSVLNAANCALAYREGRSTRGGR